MKKLSIVILLGIFFTANGIAQKVDSIFAKGNCEHCKERIEHTIQKMNGMKKVQWEASINQVICEYDSTLISNDNIQQAIAKAGHDTKKYRAEDKVYKNLPACCKYDRDPIQNSNSKIQTIDFRIEGMTCAEGCAKGIEMNVYKQKGVKFCEVNYDTKKARVIYDSSKITKEEIVKMVESFQPDGEMRVYKVVF